MAEVLIPIAISSELDITGEERIHVAPYKRTIRSPYVAPPVTEAFFVYFLGEIIGPATSAVGYAKVDLESGGITLIDDIGVADYNGLHEGGVGTNGSDRVFVVGFVDDENLSAYSVTGGTLALAGQYVGSGRLHGMATDDNRVYVLQRDADLKLLAIDYDGAAFALTASTVVSASPGSFNHDVVLHGEYIMAFADNTIGSKTLYAYTISGTTFTQVGSLVVEIDEPGQPGMWSDGTYLYLDVEGTGDEVSVYTFNGATFTEVASTPDPSSQTNGVMGGNGRIVIRRTVLGATTLDVHPFDGVTISAATNNLATTANLAWAYDPDTNLVFTIGRRLYDLSKSFTPVLLGSNSTVLDIPDNGTPVESEIVVSGGPTLCSGIAITLNITHTYIGDLLVTITEPGGQVYTLHEDDGGSGTSIVGSFDARFPNPATVNGTWTLTITDTAEFDSGDLNSWSVTQIPAVVNNLLDLRVNQADPDESLEAGFIRVCPELSQA